MPDTAIRVEGISKQYRIGPPYQRNLQEVMGDLVTRLLRGQRLLSTID